ncbi:hypothetical protein [Agarilytica rhodophyticola]|uniref:hypothetical protein n=1 Tax=Agarilytica rhodophyticola TaxID=1737490 RepID=UPI000B3489E5|nr:hypothetical protein [Agarilytica rhodophyticola]
MDSNKQKETLAALAAQQIPSTTWSIDPLGDVWMINIVTGRAEIIMHYCEMDEKQRDEFAGQLISNVLENKRVCKVARGD